MARDKPARESRSRPLRHVEQELRAASCTYIINCDNILAMAPPTPRHRDQAQHASATSLHKRIKLPGTAAATDTDTVTFLCATARRRHCDVCCPRPSLNAKAAARRRPARQLRRPSQALCRSQHMSGTSRTQQHGHDGDHCRTNLLLSMWFWRAAVTSM